MVRVNQALAVLVLLTSLALIASGASLSTSNENFNDSGGYGELGMEMKLPENRQELEFTQNHYLQMALAIQMKLMSCETKSEHLRKGWKSWKATL